MLMQYNGFICKPQLYLRILCLKFLIAQSYAETKVHYFVEKAYFTLL